jgi:hypothetical protein
MSNRQAPRSNRTAGLCTPLGTSAASLHSTSPAFDDMFTARQEALQPCRVHMAIFMSLRAHLAAQLIYLMR